MRVSLNELAGIGLLPDKNPHEVPIGAWSSGNNITFRDGKVQKAKGNTTAYGTVGCRPQWLIPYDDPDAGAYHWVYPGIDDNDYGKIYTVTGATHTNRTRKNADAAISDISVANPTVVTIASTTYNTGDEVTITGSNSTPSIDGTHILTWVSATQFTIPVNVTVQGTTGTASIDSDYSPSMTGSNLNISWSGGVLNGLLVVNNGVDTPQKWDRSTGTLKANFEDLANWPASTSARVLRPFRSFLVAMDVTASGTRNPYRLMWSDAADPFAEPSSWAAAANNLAGDIYLSEGGDYLVDGGPLRGSFIVYKRESTYIMRYIGGNAVMQVDRLFSEHGCLATRCWAAFGDGLHFVITKGDVIVHDGSTARSIADDKVRNTIFSEIDTTYFNMCFCTPYFKQEEIWFCYSTGGDEFADKAAIWNYKTGAWSFRDLNRAAHLAYGTINETGGDTWTSVSTTWTTETSVWSEESFSPQADDLMLIQRGSTDTTANASFQQLDSGNTFNGTLVNAEAKMEKLDIAPTEGGVVEAPDTVKHLSRLYPKIQGGPVNIRTGSSMSPQGSVTWSSYKSFDATSGDYKVDCRDTGVYLALEISSGTNVDWQLDSMDMDIDLVSHGR